MRKICPFLNIALVLCVIVSLTLGCAGVRRPWRDYSERPFNSAEWLAGDRIERGRMVLDLAKGRAPNGRSHEGVVEMLGEPDLKRTIERKEVWFYRVDIGITGGMDLAPVSFDEKGRAKYGMVTGSTYSMMAKEDEL